MLCKATSTYTTIFVIDLYNSMDGWMDGWMKDHDLSPPSPLEDEDVYMWVVTIWSVEIWGLRFRLFGV
jgi:hypothetical protein